ncbi:MAG: carboxypeptidase-like regulatory domain-containing protein [Myxococcota bacterium]
MIPPIEVGRSSELQAAMISGDGSRVFVLAFPGQLYAYHLDADPERGEALAMPTPTDDWVRRGGFGDTGRVTGRLPVLGDADDARGTARVESLTRLGDAPAFAVEVRADREGRFAVDVPYGEYVVTGEGFRGAVEVFADRATVENTELLADADLEPGDALHWWPAGGPIRSEEPVTMTVTPPAAIDRADGTRAATSIWGDWIDVEPAIQRAFEVRWDTGEPIVGATVLQEGLAGELQVAAGRAVADEEGRGWVVMSSKPTSLRVDGLEAPPTWPIEPELRYDELRWTVPRSSLRIVGLKPGQSATLSHDTRDLRFTFVPDGEGWLVRRNDEAPARPQASPRLTHVPPGRWTLTAWDPAGRASRTPVVLERGREAVVRPDWKGAGGVQIVVVDPAGRRVPGARIDVVTGLSRALDGFRVETDELGQVRVDRLPPGPVILRVIDHATRYRALVEAAVESRRTSPVLVEVRVPPDLADHPGIEFGHACVVRDPGDLRGPLDASDRVVEVGERSTDGWSPEACMAAFQDGDGTRSARVRGARGQRDVAFPGPPRCSTSGTCVQTTRSGEKVLRRGPI